MGVVILTVSMLLMTIVNYRLGKKNLIYPAFILSFVFLVSSSLCLVNMNKYKIDLGINTVLVIVLGILFFSIITGYFNLRKQKSKTTVKLSYIDVSKWLYWLVIVCQLISIVAFIKYLRSLTIAYANAGYTNLLSYSLKGEINLYDKMTKFWQPIYNELNVPYPMAYRVLNPICSAAEFIVFYVATNNFIVRKKIDYKSLIILILASIRVILNGSRSPLFRVILFILVVYYILEYKSGAKLKLTNKLIKRAVELVLLVVCLMFVMLQVTGRTGTGHVGSEIFVYVGAPIVNLDIFLKRNMQYVWTGMPVTYWGEHFFSNIYEYASRHFNLGITITSYLKFEKSNGLNTGNVYTMFTSPIYDFGYLGLIPSIGIMAIYYGVAYKKIVYKSIHKIDMNILVFAYLFNDLAMSFFSNRFYETITNMATIKIIVIAYVLVLFLRVVDSLKTKTVVNRGVLYGNCNNNTILQRK